MFNWPNRKNYFNLSERLRSLDLKDITLFTAIVDRAKKDFPAHKDYKTYSKLIDANLKNITKY